MKNGSEYLQEALGDVLAKALAAVAKERPQDPIQFLADFLQSARKEQKKDKDRDSGHYEDAPNDSVGTASTLELRDVDTKDDSVGGQQRDSALDRSRGGTRRRRTAQSEPAQPVINYSLECNKNATLFLLEEASIIHFWHGFYRAWPTIATICQPMMVMQPKDPLT